MVVEGQRKAEFESFHGFNSRMSISRDGTLAFVSKFHERDGLFLYDLVEEKLLGQWQFEEIISLSNPTFRPDGKAVAFAGLTQNGLQDLYLFDLETERIRPLTPGPVLRRRPGLVSRRHPAGLRFRPQPLGAQRRPQHLSPERGHRGPDSLDPGTLAGQQALLERGRKTPGLLLRPRGHASDLRGGLHPVVGAGDLGPVRSHEPGMVARRAGHPLYRNVQTALRDLPGTGGGQGGHPPRRRTR